MNKKLWTVAALASALAVAACQPVDSEEASDDPVVSAVPTPVSSDGADGGGEGDGPLITSGQYEVDHIGISVETFNPPSWGIAGLEVQLTADLSTRFGSIVPDNTVVSFVASAGRVGDSDYIGDPTIDDGNPIKGFATCLTVSGQCSVTWRSGPVSTTETDQIGVVSVMAMVEGSDLFLDSDRDGLYGPGDSIQRSYGDPFNDKNGDGVITDYEYSDGYGAFNEEEYVYDIDQDGLDASFSAYRGHRCLTADVSSGCGTSAWVYATTKLVESSKLLILTSLNASTVTLSPGGTHDFTYSLEDENGNIPPAGTTLEASCDGNVTTQIAKAEVPNMFSQSPHLFAVKVKVSREAEPGIVDCNIKTKSGAETFGDDFTVTIIP